MPLGSGPTSITYDPDNGYLYLTSTDSIVVVNTSGAYGITFPPTPPSESPNRVVSVIPDFGFPLAAAYNPQNHYLYVANAQSATVLAINTVTDKVVANISVGSTTSTPNPSFPAAIVYDPSDGYVYVFDEATARVIGINAATNRVAANISLGGVQPDYLPAAMAYDPDNGYIYVADYYADSVVVVDPSTQGVVAKTSLGAYQPAGIAYDPLTHMIYVAATCTTILVYQAQSGGGARLNQQCASSPPASVYVGAIFTLNPDTQRVVSNITVGAQPGALVYDPANSYIYVVDPWSESVYVVDPILQSVVAQIHNAGFTSPPYAAGGIAYDPHNGYIYVAGYTNNTLYAVETSSGRVVQETPLGGNPRAVAYDPVNHYIYVADTQSNAISAIDPASNTVVDTIPLPITPQAMICDPENGELYVAGSNNVYAVDPQTGQTVAEAYVPGAHTLVLDSGNGHIYVGGDGGVWVVSQATGPLTPLVGGAKIYQGETPLAMVYDPQNGYIYFTTGGGDLFALNPTGFVIGETRLGPQPTSAIYDPQNGYIYVADRGSDSVVAVNPANLTVEADIPLGETPAAMTYDPHSGELYVADYQLTVSVINTTTNTLAENIRLTAPDTTLTAIAYDPANNYIYLANSPGGFYNNSISVVVGVLPPSEVFILGPPHQAANQTNQTLPYTSDILLLVVAAGTALLIYLAKRSEDKAKSHHTQATHI